MHRQLDTIADLKKSLIGQLYPYSPIYNYMDGHSMDKMNILSAATGEVLDPRDKLQWYHSHAVTQWVKNTCSSCTTRTAASTRCMTFLTARWSTPLRCRYTPRATTMIYPIRIFTQTSRPRRRGDTTDMLQPSTSISQESYHRERIHGPWTSLQTRYLVYSINGFVYLSLIHI